ncbi:MAG: hypothetical protein IJQ71_07605 [Clostridia bacterium]|nr:hypothetical protein [Clostridia bacterium]
MSKAKRFLLLILCVAVMGLWTTAHADMVTVGIYLTGMVPAEDGSWNSVATDGDFRIYQNGQEVGTIAAGRETLTLNSMDRIRIEPVPQSFAPGWDLSTASLTADLSGAGTQMIPLTVYQRKAQAVTPEPAVETPAPEAATEEPEIIAEVTPEAIPEEDEPIIEAPVQTGPIQTPTLPPYTAAEVTPEPIPASVQGTGTGNIRVQVFFDKNANGAQTSTSAEGGVGEITVYLLNEAGEMLTSAVTGADGMVVFSDLPDGNYRTKMYLPEGWYFTPFGGENSIALNAYRPVADSSQTSGIITVAAGTESEQGIGIHNKASSMGGFIWLDETVDGLCKEDEARIPGVRIQLKHQTENLVYETESGEDGTWKIGNMYPGKYTLSISWRPEGLMLTRYTQKGGLRSFLTSDNSKRNVDANGTDRNDMNIGFNWATQIVGRCYLDANYNGKYDEGEAPLPGVKVHARFAFDDKDVGTAVSGADGMYTLSGMRKGKYNIQVILPDDGSIYSKAAPQEEGGNLFGPRGDRRDQMLQNVSLADAEMRVMNIGAIYPATVTGTVYYDDNFSAAKDGNERIAGGFLVTILDASGNVAATDKANMSGVYELTGLTPGEYSLKVQATRNYAFTKLGEGNVILNRTQGEGYSEPFRVELGERVTGKDIGMIRPGTVKGTVFADRNDNGMRDPGEEGLEGVIVRLVHETEGEAFRAEIGTDGGFLFDAVMPGRYYLEYTLPEKAIFAKTVAGGNEISDEGTTGRTESFDFVTGETKAAPLCGALLLGRIEGTAWHDHDGDGLRGSEEMLAGVTVSLVPSRNDLEAISVVTDEGGAFLLDQLHPDTYQLTVKCPDGYVMSRTDYMALPLKAGVQEQTVPLEVQMGSEWLDQAAGAVVPASISGQLWLDENNNGLFDEGEKTPAGYTVYVIDEYTGKVFDTPVTNAEGRFSAAGMIPGSFTVSMTMDERTLAPKAGDSVFHEENGALVLTGIQLQEDETREGLLMGIVRYTEISGQAWIDRGGSVEALAGVRITMKDTDGNIIATAETDGTGAYRLQQLMPGSFILDAVAPEGCVLIEPGDPRLSDTLRSVITYPANRVGGTDTMELKMDQDMERMDIGCVLPGRLGDYCWLDLNGDGLQAGDEPGIPNVRIELLRDGNVVAETITDQYGFYRFVDLYPATYTLKVYAPAEVKPTRRRTDLPVIASVLEESEETVVYSVPLTVESNRAMYYADLGFVCRKNGVLPAGVGQGATQNWIPNY